MSDFSTLCPRCGVEPESDWHRSYSCKDNECIIDPTIDAPDAIHEHLRFSIRCIRCDTGQSLMFCSDEQFDDFDIQDWPYIDTHIGKPKAGNDAGLRAKELWSLRGYDDTGVCTRYKIRPIFPSSCDFEDETKAWWRKARYRLDHLECDFLAYLPDGSYADYENLQELLVSLEGFNWQ